MQAVFVLVVRTGNMSPYGSSSLRQAAVMFLSSGAVDRAKGSGEEGVGAGHCPAGEGHGSGATGDGGATNLIVQYHLHGLPLLNITKEI